MIVPAEVTLIVLSGLPGVGKTTIARSVAKRLSATYLRADTIEHALVQNGLSKAELGGLGYCVAYELARENLGLGLSVIADSVNPWALTRDAWMAVGQSLGMPVFELEIVCSDTAEHRRRVEARSADLEAFELPTWQQVLDRDYHVWNREVFRIDTAHTTADAAVDLVLAVVRSA